MEGKLVELTKASIDSLHNDEVEYELFIFILERIIGSDFKNKYNIISKLPDGLRYLYASWHLESEVLNGGFNQYFYNTSGEFIDEAIEAFDYFGLPHLREITIKAAVTAAEEVDLMIKTKKKGTLKALSELYRYSHLGEADDAFYQYCDNISQARIKKIRLNVEDFILQSLI